MRLSLIFVAWLFSISACIAESTVNAVITFGPGASTDIITKHFAAYVKEKKNINMVFTYKPGADALVGLQHIAASPADGKTIGFTTVGGLANGVVRGLTFDYISATRKNTDMLVTHPGNPILNYNELLVRTKFLPQVTVGYSGPGMKILLDQIMKGTTIGPNVTLVPFKGGAQLFTDILGKHIDIAMIPGNSTIRAHALAGSIRVLAVSSVDTAFPNAVVLPNVINSWVDSGGHCIIFPSGTPAPILSFWRNVVQEYLLDPGVLKEFAEDKTTTFLPGPKELGNIVHKLQKHLESN